MYNYILRVLLFHMIRIPMGMVPTNYWRYYLCDTSSQSVRGSGISCCGGPWSVITLAIPRRPGTRGCDGHFYGFLDGIHEWLSSPETPETMRVIGFASRSSCIAFGIFYWWCFPLLFSLQGFRRDKPNRKLKLEKKPPIIDRTLNGGKK